MKKINKKQQLKRLVKEWSESQSLEQDLIELLSTYQLMQAVDKHLRLILDYLQSPECDDKNVKNTVINRLTPLLMDPDTTISLSDN